MAICIGGNQLIVGRVKRARGVRMGGGAGFSLVDDFERANGSLAAPWTGATWAIVSGKAVNTPSLGSDLIVNGTFAADATWTKGTNWTIGSGVGTHTASGTADAITQTPLTSTLWYKMTWDITAWSAGVLNARIGNSSFIGPNRTAIGSYIDTRRANTTGVGVNASTTGAGSVDNVVVKNLPLADLFLAQPCSKNGYAQAIWNAVLGTQCGVFMCLDNPAAPANFVVAYLEGPTAQRIILAKCVAGVYTELIGTATNVTYADGKNIKLVRVDGTNTFQVWYGAAGSEIQIGTTQTISDASVIDNVYSGIFSTNEQNSCDAFAFNRDYVRPAWSRQAVMAADAVWEQTNVFESNVIYEAGAQLLSGTVYKLWYTGGWGTPSIGYAESADGLTWTKYGSNPVVANHCRSMVFKDGSTYYMYTAPTAQTTIDLYTSSNGVAWTLDTAGVIGLGAGGQWDDQLVANVHVWKESANDWRMMYEAKKSTTSWRIGYATSSDGRVWSKSGSNPVITGGGNGGQGGPWVAKVSGTYYLWCHRSLAGTNGLPTDIYRYTSTDLVTWTPMPNYPMLARITSDEGAATEVGQAADPFLLVRDNQLYLFYSGSANGLLQAGAQRIKLAIADISALTA